MSHELREERISMNNKNDAEIRFKNVGAQQEIVMQGSMASVHAGILMLIKRLANTLGVKPSKVLEALTSMNNLGDAMFESIPDEKDEDDTLTPMERFMKEISKNVWED